MERETEGGRRSRDRGVTERWRERKRSAEADGGDGGRAREGEKTR